MSAKLPEKSLELVVEKTSPNSSLFSIYPLPPGMGYTLASPLRRTIYDVEKGFRIRNVHFVKPTVAHPYEALSGVSQDAQEIILRLKKVVFKRRNKDSEEAKICISIKGKKVFKAGDIDEEGFPFEVVNPEYVICDMDENVQLTVEFTINEGTGYVSAEEHEALMAEKNQAEQEPGFAIDTIYTPVTNVKTKVENVLANKRVDYEKLSVEISTNGSVDSYDVWKNACKFLSETFLVLADKTPVDLLKRNKDKKAVEADRIRLDKLLCALMETLEGFPPRPLNCLRRAGYTRLKDVIVLPDKELLAIPNFGQKCLDELKVFLAHKNLTLGRGVKNSFSA